MYNLLEGPTVFEEWMDDARKIPDIVMDYLRKIAVRAVEEKGSSPEVVADIFGVSRSAIYSWLNRYQEGGYSALNTHQSPGAPCIITGEMDWWLSYTVRHRTPEDFGYDTALWTRDILAQVLGNEFSISVGGSTISLHLRKMGLSYQKPWFRSKERDQEEADRFLNDTFPRIQRLALRMGMDILFEDEAGISLQTHSGKTWGAVGATPEVAVTGKHAGFNMLSTVTKKGDLNFSISKGKINSDRFIEFLKQLINVRTKPFILILDNASFHHSKKVRDFVRSHRNKIRVYFLPRYSPEMNPDEQVWNQVKSKKLGRQSITNKEDLKRRLNSVLRSLQYRTEVIKSFFQLPHTQYAE